MPQLATCCCSKHRMGTNINKENAETTKNNTSLCHNSINKVFNLDEQINLMSQVQSFIDLVWNENRNISTCFIMKIMGLMKKITPLSFFAWFKWVSIWVWEACYCWRFVDSQKPARSFEIVHENSKFQSSSLWFLISLEIEGHKESVAHKYTS